ncbi:hypothetical protein PUN28_011082 [Cardiocondyla obscurior]|uniref:Uncharacterized protein n=1 Tax=Cardiocondyla obscurior TaxID=286306 RepID=A0AAW2FMH1_9HYME
MHIQTSSRWFSSHAFEDSCYTHRDFARLMHSCTYPSKFLICASSARPHLRSVRAPRWKSARKVRKERYNKNHKVKAKLRKIHTWRNYGASALSSIRSRTALIFFRCE